MLITKNDYGVLSVFEAKGFDQKKLRKASGSSLERKLETDEQFIRRLLRRPLIPGKKPERKAKAMSPHTKSKIKAKIFAFSAIHNYLSFVTLTFVNQVSEELAVKILAKF